MNARCRLAALLTAALATFAAACGHMAKPRTRAFLTNGADIGTVDVSVLTVAPWDKYVEDLQPQFELSPSQALARVVPKTQDVEERVTKTLSASLALQGSAEASVSRSVTTTSGETSEAAETEDEGATSTTTPSVQVNVGTCPSDGACKSEASAGEEKDAEAEESGDEAEETQEAKLIERKDVTVDIDPFSQYAAAAALYEDVKMVSRALEDAAITSDYRAYVVRMQVAVTPHRRGLPYDTLVDVSFFSNGDSKPPRVIPLLVNENLERSLVSRSTARIVELALTVEAMAKIEAARSASRSSDKRSGSTSASANSMLKGAAKIARRVEKLRATLGNDLNSLLLVTQAAPGTLRVRLGAMNQGSSDLGMVPRAHVVSFLLLLPSSTEKEPPLDATAAPTPASATGSDEGPATDTIVTPAEAPQGDDAQAEAKKTLVAQEPWFGKFAVFDAGSFTSIIDAVARTQRVEDSVRYHAAATFVHAKSGLVVRPLPIPSRHRRAKELKHAAAGSVPRKITGWRACANELHSKARAHGKDGLPVALKGAVTVGNGGCQKLLTADDVPLVAAKLRSARVWSARPIRDELGPLDHLAEGIARVQCTLPTAAKSSGTTGLDCEERLTAFDDGRTLTITVPNVKDAAAALLSASLHLTNPDASLPSTKVTYDRKAAVAVFHFASLAALSPGLAKASQPAVSGASLEVRYAARAAGAPTKLVWPARFKDVAVWVKKAEDATVPMQFDVDSGGGAGVIVADASNEGTLSFALLKGPRTPSAAASIEKVVVTTRGCDLKKVIDLKDSRVVPLVAGQQLVEGPGKYELHLSNLVVNGSCTVQLAQETTSAAKHTFQRPVQARTGTTSAAGTVKP